MKTLIAFLFALLAGFNVATAQSNFYNFTVFAGVSPKQTPFQASKLMERQDAMKEFQFNLKEIEKNYTFGFRTNIRFSRPFFGTIGLEYNRQRQHYSMVFSYLEPDGRKDHELMVSHDMLTLPVGVGVKLNKVDITSGLQMRYNLKSEMELDTPMGIEMNKSNLEMGWYTGVGVSFDRTRVGIQYQAAMNRYGHDLNLHQKPMELNSIPGNFSFTLGYSF